MLSLSARRGSVGAVLMAAGLGAATLAACATGDGRSLEPPSSYQRWRIASTAPTTTITPRDETQFPPALPAEGTDDLGATAPGHDLGRAVVDLAAPWENGGAIGEAFTCDGGNLTPLFTWTDPVGDSIELALSFTSDEPLGTAAAAEGTVEQAGDTVQQAAGTGEYVHWLVIGLPPVAGHVGGDDPVEVGIEGRNSAGGSGWMGPCPPDDTPATYHVTLHYLDQQLEMPADAADLLTAIRAATIAEVSLTGFYEPSTTTITTASGES